MEKDLATLYDIGHIPGQKQTGESSVLFIRFFLKANQITHVSLSPEKSCVF